jgi:hypothetical protein
MTMGDEEELTALLKEANDMTAHELVLMLWKALMETVDEKDTVGLVAFAARFHTPTGITAVKFGVTILEVTQEQIGKMN